MNPFPFFCLLFLLPTFTTAQRIKHKKIRYENSDLLKEKYDVLSKYPFTKHGPYASYYQNGKVKETGQYEMNKKIGEWKVFFEDGTKKEIARYQNGKKIEEQRFGIWWEYVEDGQVKKGYDYDKDEKLETEISVPLRYPSDARKRGIEGAVRVRLVQDDDCNIRQLEIVEGVGYGCNEEAIRCVKRLVALTQKHDPDKCHSLDRTITFNFQLQ
jgi:TonB family protein